MIEVKPISIFKKPRGEREKRQLFKEVSAHHSGRNQAVI